MEFRILPGNKIEYPTRKKVVKGSYILKFVTINLTASDPNDLAILMMHKKKIEEAIVKNFNSKRRDEK